jgi:biopolymer transport protein ExbD
MAMSIGATDDSAPIADMNTTPLVDVMLVLLILFIITLPVLTHSTNLQIRGKANQPNLQVSPDRRASYDTVAKVLALAQRSGMQRIGFVGQEQFAD